MDMPENQLKYENYREQFKRLNSALRSGFNLEAMFIWNTMRSQNSQRKASS